MTTGSDPLNPASRPSLVVVSQSNPGVVLSGLSTDSPALPGTTLSETPLGLVLSAVDANGTTVAEPPVDVIFAGP